MTEEFKLPWSDPNFQVLYAPPSYGELTPESDGVYKFIIENNVPVAVAWTDLSQGAGIVTIQGDAASCSTVRNFLTDMATVEFPAPQAYILIDTKAVTSDERTGRLQDVLDAVSHVLETGEIPPEKEENIDD